MSERQCWLAVGMPLPGTVRSAHAPASSGGGTRSTHVDLAMAIVTTITSRTNTASPWPGLAVVQIMFTVQAMHGMGEGQLIEAGLENGNVTAKRASPKSTVPAQERAASVSGGASRPFRARCRNGVHRNAAVSDPVAVGHALHAT